MLVWNWMKTDGPVAQSGDSMAATIRKMKDNKVQMMPVMEKGRLVGVVTDRDLKRASASDATSLDVHELLYLLDRITIAGVMTRNPVTVHPDHTLEEAAQLMLAHRISGMPVVNEKGDLMGTIMQSDLFRAFIAVTGIEKKGVQFALELKDLPGTIKEAADRIRKYGGRVISILSIQSENRPGWRRVYLRVWGIDRLELHNVLDALRGCGEVCYMVDHRYGTRELYSLAHIEREPV